MSEEIIEFTEFDFTSIEEIEYFMKKYSQKFPDIDNEILWHLFLHYKGDTYSIKKHVRLILKKPKHNKYFIFKKLKKKIFQKQFSSNSYYQFDKE